MSTKYRPEVDGLRAVAVLPVMFFHAGFPYFHGGYVGVDVFFVISGYLITSLIHPEIADGSFSILHFYERRARRILPALFFVCLCCLPFAFAWLLPDELLAFGKSLVAVNLFSSNIYFYFESGYWARHNELVPLLHTWSLGVEEQYYILYPLLLVLLERFLKRGWLMLALAVLFAASLGLAQFYFGHDRDFNFYMLPTRAWELMLGALVALSPMTKFAELVPAKLKPVIQGLPLIGLGLIFGAIVTFDNTTSVPGLAGLVPTVGAALILAFATSDSVAGRLLSVKPLVGIGLISYSAYLWHQPLFVFARMRLLSGVTAFDFGVLILVTLGLAYLSWRYVERPFRQKTLFSRRHIFAAAALGSACIMLVGGLSVAVGHATLPQPGTAQERQAQEQHALLLKHCFQRGAKHPIPECLIGGSDREDIAVWADSYGPELAFQLGEQLKSTDHAVRQYALGACLPVNGVSVTGKPDGCARFNKEVFHRLLHHDEIKTVVLTARWTFIMEGVPFDNGEGGVAYGGTAYYRPVGAHGDFKRNPDRKAILGKAMRRSIQRLLDAGKQVVLVYPVPEAGWDVPLTLERARKLGLDKAGPLSTDWAAYKARAKDSSAQFDLLGDQPNLLRIYPDRLLCNNSLAGRCVNEMDGRALYKDDNHLNAFGAGLVARDILKQMRAKGWLDSAAPAETTPVQSVSGG